MEEETRLQRSKRHVSEEEQHSFDDAEILSRTRSKKSRETDEEKIKSNRLKARLNMVIAGLVLGIIIVYLIMFFVNF